MEAFAELMKGLTASPSAAMLAIALVALGYLYRQREADTKAHAEKIQALNDKHAQTIEKIIPLTEKLGEGVIILERLMDKG